MGKFDIRISEVVCQLFHKPVKAWIPGLKAPHTINEILASFAAYLKDVRNVAVDSNALHGFTEIDKYPRVLRKKGYYCVVGGTNNHRNL